MATKIIMTKWANGRGVDLRFERGNDRPAPRVSLTADEVEQLAKLLSQYRANPSPILAHLPRGGD